MMTQNLESLWKWRSKSRVGEKREWARFLFLVPSPTKPYRLCFVPGL